MAHHSDEDRLWRQAALGSIPGSDTTELCYCGHISLLFLIDVMVVITLNSSGFCEDKMKSGM